MKRLKNVGVFVLGAIIGWLIGSVIKYHEFPIIITGGQVGSIAEWLGAIGTIAAVIVALNNRWDFWAPIAENKLNRDIKEFNLRFNKQYRFINSYSIFSMYYTNLFEKLNDNKKINEQDLNTLKTLTKKLKDPGLLRNTEYVVDDIMKRLAMMDINSSNFRNELRDLIIMISDKGENIRKEVADYMSENHKMQQKIQKMKKKYKIPEELIE